MKSDLFCITGWHFPLDFFQTIATIQQAVDVYVLSHKDPRLVPERIFDILPPDRVLFRSNIGYDWGCYQQFLNTGIWEDYETLFFMHDDLEIHDFGFIEHAKRLLEEHAVIGNGYGKGGVSSSKVASHPYAYAHSHWKPPSYEFEHKTIRGSFMATTASFLEETGSFEVYWDPLKLSIGFGNWSTRATCGKMESVFGPACFGYLSDTFGRSEYIEEFMRGEQDGVKYKPAGLKGKVYDFIKWYSRIYLELYYRKRSILGRSSWSKLMIPLLRFFSGKLY